MQITIKVSPQALHPLLVCEDVTSLPTAIHKTERFFAVSFTFKITFLPTLKFSREDCPFWSLSMFCATPNN